MEDDRGDAEDVWNFEESRNGVFFEVANVILVVCEAFEDILEGVEFEGGEAAFCPPFGLVCGMLLAGGGGAAGYGGRFTS